MLLAERVGDFQEDRYAADAKHIHLYKSVLAEHREVVDRKGRLYYKTLWSSVAPSGNVYRYLGISAELWQHSADIWGQIEALAEKHKGLLGGDLATKDERKQVLVRALSETRVRGSPELEHGEQVTGFKPLEEFLTCKARSFGPWAFPTQDDRLREWVLLRLLGWMVCSTQLIAPVVILLDEWFHASNRLRDPAEFFRTVRFREVICFGTNARQVLHTLMGVLLMELVLLVIHTYVQGERAGSSKAAVLPTGRFWFVLGNFTNIWCCFWTTIAIPFRFWNEENSTAIAMDSMTLLFIFMLDDLCGYAATYMGKSDEDYQRDAAWQMAMLSMCPVKVADLVNPDAKMSSELWNINFDDSGTLLSAENSSVSVKKRVERAQAEEKSALLQSDDLRFEYALGENRVTCLPHPESRVVAYAWQFMDYIMLLLQVFMPIIWMAVNKRCGVE